MATTVQHPNQTSPENAFDVIFLTDDLRKGGKAEAEAAFKSLECRKILVQLLRAANFDVEKNYYRFTVLSMFIRNTNYPTVSNVLENTQQPGVEFRIKPNDSYHRGFQVRMVVNEAMGLSKQAVALRLRAAAARLYGASVEAEPPVPEADKARAVKEVETLIGVSFNSDDKATWAQAVARSVNPGESPAKWEGVLQAAVNDGRLVWVAGAGYAVPLPAPARLTSVLPADPPKTEKPAPSPKPAVAPSSPVTPLPPATPPSTPPAPLTPAAVSDFDQLMEEFGTFQQQYHSTGQEVENAEWALRDANSRRDKAEAALKAAQEALKLAEEAAAAAKTRLGNARMTRAASANTVNPSVLLALAAQLEAMQKAAKDAGGGK